VIVEAETEHGETLARPWRHEDGFTPGTLAERVRWQLDGWLAANTVQVDAGDVRAQQDVDAFADSGLDSTTGALTRLTLVPDEVIAVPARQLGFFGGDAAAAARADRALSRVQGLLEYECVGTFVEQGGRTPAERVRFVPWGEPREPARPLRVGTEVTPWPGALPAPAPARVLPGRGLDAELLDDLGAAVRVSGRGEALAVPARLRCQPLAIDGAVRAWAGPWPSDVRWWDARDRRRGARWQVVVPAATGDVACLVLVEGTRATVEALYD
jgi:protein ImuB